MSASTTSGVREGIVLSLAAFLIWGLFPLFFKTLSGVDASEVLAHRIMWASALLLALSLFGRRGSRLANALTSRRALAVLLLSTLLISVNWYVFIYAVDTDRVLEASLGYYITPLASVLMGAIFLGERPTRLQQVSILLAATGVAVKVWAVGQLPTISIILAVSFGGYGFARKISKIDSISALTVETTLLAPLALLYALYLGNAGKAVFLAESVSRDMLLACSGLVTVVPLLLYGSAIHRLRLSTIGLLQYIVPTIQFLLAVLAFGEPFTGGHLLTFSFIWAGLVLYSWEMQRMAGAGK